jgi:hypothetical protein
MVQTTEDGDLHPANKGTLHDLAAASNTSMAEMRAAQRANEEYNLPLFAQRYMVEPIDHTRYANVVQPFLVVTLFPVSRN